MDRTPRRTDTTTHRGAVPGLMSTLPSVSTASSRAAATDDHTSVLVCPPAPWGGALNDTAIRPSVQVSPCVCLSHHNCKQNGTKQIQTIRMACTKQLVLLM